MTRSSFREFICRLGFLIDQYGFPAAMAYCVMDKSATVGLLAPGALESFRRVLAHDSQMSDGIVCSRFMSEGLMALYNIVALWAFLIRKKPTVKSTTIQEVIVPLTTIAIYASINFLGKIPPSVNVLLAPPDHALLLSLIGSFFVFAGLALSIVAIYQLRHSIAVLVQVRDVVSSGLYRHVRHPIYLGYFIQIFGFLLVIPYFWTILWAIMAGYFFIARARLEERKIASAFPAYREYMARTPFLIPWNRKTT
jgi:protein-S-isoprenylcysteine O-methyltransferase Ste14